MDTWKEGNPIPAVTLDDVADHLDHIVEVAGIDHVGLGSDFDGVRNVPEGLDDVSGYPALLVVLLERGWSRSDIARLAGLNLLRVMRQAEEVAAVLQRTETPIDTLIEESDDAEAPTHE
jgi:membrane dipeptidase